MLESRFAELYVNVHVKHKKLYHKISLASILKSGGFGGKVMTVNILPYWKKIPL
jgi:hypothetical protein